MLFKEDTNFILGATTVTLNIILLCRGAAEQKSEFGKSFSGRSSNYTRENLQPKLQLKANKKKIKTTPSCPAGPILKGLRGEPLPPLLKPITHPQSSQKNTMIHCKQTEPQNQQRHITYMQSGRLHARTHAPHTLSPRANSHARRSHHTGARAHTRTDSALRPLSLRSIQLPLKDPSDVLSSNSTA